MDGFLQNTGIAFLCLSGLGFILYMVFIHTTVIENKIKLKQLDKEITEQFYKISSLECILKNDKKEKQNATTNASKRELG